MGKGHGGLYNASTKEERRQRKATRREREQIKFIALNVIRWESIDAWAILPLST